LQSIAEQDVRTAQTRQERLRITGHRLTYNAMGLSSAASKINILLLSQITDKSKNLLIKRSQESLGQAL
jgi:hypothetical protein